MQVFSEGVRVLDPHLLTTSSRLLQPFKRPGILENSEAAAAAHAPASPFAALIPPSRSPVDGRIVRESVFCVSLSLLKIFLKKYSL